MELTHYLAKLIGFSLLLMGLIIVMKIQNFQKVLEEFSESHALMTIIGILPLVAGLALIIAHNRWSQDPTVLLVTIFGWVIFLSGVVRLFFSKQVMKLLGSCAKKERLIIIPAIISIVLGMLYTYLGMG